jgi:glycosyltransferase involved in cell wall biosynthesis
MSTPIVSAIIPVFNAEPYLNDLLNSLQSQTLSNFEAIFIDDGSSDRSVSFLAKAAERDSRIKLHCQKNTGSSGARNNGLKRCRGDYVCFIDSDDFIEANTFAEISLIARDNSADVVLFGIDQYREKDEAYAPMPWAIVEGTVPADIVFNPSGVKNFYKNVVGFTVNKLYRSDYLESLELVFPEIGAHEDMPFTYAAMSATNRMLYTREVYYHYRRQREGSRSDNNADHYEYMLAALQSLRHELIRLKLWSSYEQQFVNYTAHMIDWKLSSLEDEAKDGFCKLLNSGWLKRFGLYNYPKSYYWNKKDWSTLDRVSKLAYDICLTVNR